MDRFELTAVTVRAFYGHPQTGIAAPALGPGVNVVYGPNGQGKTTLARAIHGVLWPETVAAYRPTVSATFHFAGDDWRVEVEGGAARYQREGAPADRLPLPDPSFRDRYQLSLGDLLLADGDAFADRVRRDAAGGVDLDAIRDRLGFKAAPTQRLKVTAEAEKAARAVQSRQHQLDALRAREHELGEITDRAAQAADAAELADLYRLLEDAAERNAQAAAADRVVAEFDPALVAVAPDTQERYDDLGLAVRRAEERLSEVTKRRAQARAALADHGWDDVALPEEAELRARAAEVEAATRALDAAERARAAAAERERRARAELGGHIETAPTVDIGALGDVAAFVQRAGRVRGRVEEFEGKKLAVKARLNAVRFHDADELARGADLLRRWLAHTSEAERAPAGLRPPPVWGGAAGLAVAAVALGVWLTPGAFWLLGGAVALAAVAVALGRATEAAESPAAAARQAFAAMPTAEPATWTIPDVQKRLDEIERAALDQKERQLWQDAVDEIERALVGLDGDRAALDAQAEQIGAGLGLDVPETPEGLHLLTRGVLAWQESARDLGVADAARDRARDGLQTALDLFNHVLDGVPVEPATDAASAAGAVATVGRQAAERDRLRAEVGRLDDAVGVAEEAVAEARAGREVFLERLGLEEPADHAVAALSAALPAYTAAVEEAARARTLAEEATARARAHARWTAEAAALDSAALAEARSQADTRAARRDEWLEEKAAIQTLVGEARRASALAAAHAEHARALDALEAVYDEQADALVGHALAEAVAEETRDEHLPQVFKRAREVLADITDDRFRLDFDDGAFRAFDAARGRGYALDELSSGTRVQLLLAVRLAFAEQQEVGVRLPLLLDEALANSDDERAGAIVEAVLHLCRQGRQVFYFTAQAEEVAKWHRLAEEHPDVDCHFVGLPDATALAAVDLNAMPTPGTTRPVPDADGQTMADYADAVGVASWSGWDALDALHVWYLLDTPAQVEACLRRGYATWGQLRAAAERGKRVPVDLDAARDRARAVQAWQAAWREGRGRPVDRAVLEASGAVTEAFLDEVDALCGDADGDAQALVDCLHQGDVARFQARQAERLEAFLLDEGYLTPDDRLSDDEVRRRVAEAGPPDALDLALAVLARIRERAETVAA
ncbi:AAA family ATPase [Rubrivirga sp.]|uniref:AAA family ATPase n=1 Tax=Rubrivirga sp. TaxID=1885344 RepID=UPI003B52EB3B